MNSRMAKLRPLLSGIRGLWKDERGITGLETSIMLIAFVVVASVFAFAVLRMGVFSAGTTEKTVTKGLEELTAVLALRGPVVAYAHDLPTGGYIQSVSFLVRDQQDSVELSDDAVIVNFKQGDSCIPLQFGESDRSPGLSWSVDWINGPGPVLSGINAPTKIVLTLYGLKQKLTATDKFALAIKPRAAPPEPCIPPATIGDSSSVLLVGNIDLQQEEILDDGSRAEFGLDYYDKQSGSDGGVTPVRDLQEGRYVTHLTFLVHNSSPSGTIDLSSDTTVVSYYDSVNPGHSDLQSLDDIANTQVGLGWGILGDSGQEVGPGERAEIQINLFGLDTLLGAGAEFTVEIRPQVGEPLIMRNKKLPADLETRNVLD